MKLNTLVLTILSLNGATAFLSRSQDHRRQEVRPSSTPSCTFGAISNASSRPLPARRQPWVGSRQSSSLDAAKIIIAGAPASGKGTQCEKIKESFGVVHLSTGDMLRAAVAAGTNVGKEAKSYMDSGKLVPDSTIIGVVRLHTQLPNYDLSHTNLPLPCLGERSLGR